MMGVLLGWGSDKNAMIISKHLSDTATPLTKQHAVSCQYFDNILNKMFTIKLIASVLLHNGIQQMANLFEKSNNVAYYVSTTMTTCLMTY